MKAHSKQFGTSLDLLLFIAVTLLFISCCLLFYALFLCRYLSYIMDVATPTADWLNLVHGLLLPILMKSDGTATLSHQEVHYFSLLLDMYCFSDHCVFEHGDTFRFISMLDYLSKSN